MTEKLYEIGSKVVVHKPDGISRSRRGVQAGDIGKVVAVEEGPRILLYNPKWDNIDTRTFDCSLKYKGLCVVFWQYELREK